MSTQKNSSKSRGRILVVDDDPEVLESSRLWLKLEGFEVFTASNHADALRIADQNPIEVALVDFRLGAQTGLEITESIKQLDETIKVIIITGYPTYETAVESMKLGVSDYLSKGSSNQEVLVKIDKALAQRKKDLIKSGKYQVKGNIQKFVIICNHSLIAERLKTFAVNHPEFKLIRSFKKFEELQRERYLPEINIVLICASCCIRKEEDCFSFFKKLYRVLPTTVPIIINENFPEKIKVDMLKVGVKGFFPLDMNSDKLEKGMTLVARGEIWANRSLIIQAIESGVEYLERITDAPGEFYNLTDREREILKIMVLGLKNKQIADKLFISEMTVKTHINKIFKKLKVENRIQAVLKALEKKLI